MTRINTNVGSLVGRNNLQRANASLAQSLTRLSTGLRINTGKDDPAGLIASENLRSDITSIRKAISNTDRANQVIATADSALGQVSSLLNDIRGLVTESANAGALSDEQISANQLQVDSSLEALNRIAQTTTFQGRRLLDGSLDFVTSPDAGFSNLSDLQIDQANLGATGEVDVNIDVTSSATRAQIDVTDIAAAVPGVESSGTISFADNTVAASTIVSFDRETAPATEATGDLDFVIQEDAAVQATGAISLATEATGSFNLTTGGLDIDLTAITGGNLAGVAGNGAITDIVINEGATIGGGGSDDVNVSLDGSNQTLTLDFEETAITGQDVVDAINNVNTSARIGTIVFAGSNGATLAAGDLDATATGTSVALGGGPTSRTITFGGAAVASNLITLTAVADGALDGTLANSAFTDIQVSFGNGSEGVTDGGSGALVVALTQTAEAATISDIVSAIDNSSIGLDAATSAGATLARQIDFSGVGEITLGTGGFTAGVGATVDNVTITVESVSTGAGRNFDIRLVSANAATINDADGAVGVAGADGILAGIVGDENTGFTITIADDQDVDLTDLASFIEANVVDGLGEAVTATFTGDVGNPTNDTLNLSDSEGGTPVGSIPAAAVAIENSTDATIVSETIEVFADAALGAAGNDLSINFTTGTVASGTTALTDNGDGSFLITIDDAGPVDYQDIADEIDNITGVASTQFGSTTLGTEQFVPGVDTAATGNTGPFTGGRDAGTDVITITADEQDASFDASLTVNTANSTIGDISVTQDSGTGAIVVSVDSTSTYQLSDIRDAINTQLTGYTAVLSGDGNATFDNNDSDDNVGPVYTNLSGGQAPTGGLLRDAVIELSGALGSEVFNLRAGTDIATLESQIDLVSDATGIQATVNGTSLELTSTEFGSDAFVDVRVREEASDGTFTTAFGGDPGDRESGSDVVATVNGIAATGVGNQLSINTATLDLTTTVAQDTTGQSAFTITGGGALFQLGPDVVSNQQARLGIGSVNTAALGGVSGSLFQLGSGQTADLLSDATTAASIVEEAINQVTSLRGRLGAFQRTTLETNKNALNDTLANLTEAESSIRDADFAAETASLTRSQILVQSGTRVLAIANQNPQNVLGLLG